MVLNREPIKNWFGYSRRERRASFILLIIIVSVISLRYIFPDKNTEIEDLTILFSESEKAINYDLSEKPDTGRMFYFDPNLISYDSLLRLGLTEKVARTLISYRNSGGKFKVPSDIANVYGIDKNWVERLKNYVKIKHDSFVGIRYGFTPQKTIIDINQCDSASFVRLPGIGPVLSVRIIKYRTLLGGFARVEQLKEVYGLPEDTYNLIKERLYADSQIIKKINVNTSDYKQLASMIYLENYEIISILKYRELNGSIRSLTELIDNKLLTADKAEKAGPYLKFE